MKPVGIAFRAKRKYIFVMILCFLYAGFLLVSFVNNLYGLFWQANAQDFPRFAARMGDMNSMHGIDANGDANFLRTVSDPVARLASPQALSYLIGGIVLILAEIGRAHV